MPPDWSAVDDMFGAFIAGFDPGRLVGFELALYQHHRFLRLSEQEAA